MINEEECIAAGLDIRKISSLSRRLSRISREVGELGLVIFGGSGSGSLRYDDGTGKGKLIVAEFGTSTFDGGDGGCSRDDSGLLRGEEG